MRTSRPVMLAALLASTIAVAQEATDSGTPSAEPAPAAAPPASEALDALIGRLNSLEEQYSETKTSVLSLERLKLSGYIQARYLYQQGSRSGVDEAGNPLVKDGFTIRRGRLKATYTAPHSMLVLQIDTTGREVALRDAEVHLFEPWTGQKLELVLGQMKSPFGYDIIQSSSEREFPERSQVVRAFAPGERDRGVRLGWKRGIWRATAGVFEGNSIQNKGFIGVDNDTEKDLIGRLGVDLKWFSGGVSGWAGKTFRPGNYAGLNNVPGKHFARNRIGADAQLYLDLLPVGATAVKAEFIAGTTYHSGGVEQFGQTALGWYALLVQNLGLSNEVAVRYDYFDGYTGTPDGVSPSDATRSLSTNAVGTIGFLVMHHFDEALKATVSFEIPMVARGGAEASAPGHDLLTVQLQAKF